MARQKSADGVRVAGLNELNRALRDLGPEAQKKLKQTNLEAAEHVTAAAKAKAAGLGGVAAKVGATMVAKGYTAAAGVSLGPLPYAGGAEFGSLRYMQFQPWRGNGPDAGYFLYPTIRAEGDWIEDEYGKAIDKVIREVGLK